MSGYVVEPLSRIDDSWIRIAVLFVHVVMNNMTYCELCEMDRGFCEHGLAERRRNAAGTVGELLISPNGVAHFPVCPPQGRGGKDSWDRAIVLTSKDANLTKAHARYLESRFITLATQARRSRLLNGTAPALLPLPEADVSDMEYFIAQAKIILPVLGVNILRSVGIGADAAAEAEAPWGGHPRRYLPCI
jgi:hypothetical protein